MLALALLVPLALLDGVVLSDLWAWFITPVFGGPALTTTQAVGISIVATFFKPGLTRSRDPDAEAKGILAHTASVGLKSALFLLFVWGYGALWFAAT